MEEVSLPGSSSLGPLSLILKGADVFSAHCQGSEDCGDFSTKIFGITAFLEDGQTLSIELAAFSYLLQVPDPEVRDVYNDGAGVPGPPHQVAPCTSYRVGFGLNKAIRAEKGTYQPYPNTQFKKGSVDSRTEFSLPEDIGFSTIGQVLAQATARQQRKLAHRDNVQRVSFAARTP